MTGFLSRRLIPLCLGKDSEGLQGIYPLFIPMCGNFFNGLVPFGTRFLVLSPPPRLRSLSRGYRRTRALRHLVSRWLVDVFDARFGGDSFLRTSASPRGGAQIILPLHGIFVEIWISFPVPEFALWL